MPDSESENLSIQDAAEFLAQREAEKTFLDMVSSTAEGIIAARNQLLKDAYENGVTHLDTQLSNAIADESMQKARELLAVELGNSALLPSEVKGLSKVAQSNLEALASSYYPEAYKDIEKRRSALLRQSIKLKADKRKLEKRKIKVAKELGVLSNQKKIKWRLRIWFVKEITSNILFLQLVAIVALGLGIFIGVQIPDGVVCEKGGICSMIRLKKIKVY